MAMIEYAAGRGRDVEVAWERFEEARRRWPDASRFRGRLAQGRYQLAPVFESKVERRAAERSRRLREAKLAALGSRR
jgi:hypothetical protein